MLIRKYANHDINEIQDLFKLSLGYDVSLTDLKQRISPVPVNKSIDSIHLFIYNISVKKSTSLNK